MRKEAERPRHAEALDEGGWNDAHVGSWLPARALGKKGATRQSFLLAGRARRGYARPMRAVAVKDDLAIPFKNDERNDGAIRLLRSLGTTSTSYVAQRSCVSAITVGGNHAWRYYDRL